MNHEKDEQRLLWNLKSKIQEHFKNKTLKTRHFKDFSRTTYNSRTIQAIQEPLVTRSSSKVGRYCDQSSRSLGAKGWKLKMKNICITVPFSFCSCYVPCLATHEFRDNISHTFSKHAACGNQPLQSPLHLKINVEIIAQTKK